MTWRAATRPRRNPPKKTTTPRHYVTRGRGPLPAPALPPPAAGSALRLNGPPAPETDSDDGYDADAGERKRTGLGNCR